MLKNSLQRVSLDSLANLLKTGDTDFEALPGITGSICTPCKIINQEVDYLLQ